MQVSVPHLATLDEIIAWLVEHRRQYPEHGTWHLEVRDRLIVIPPSIVTHDDIDQVVTLYGVPYR